MGARRPRGQRPSGGGSRSWTDLSWPLLAGIFLLVVFLDAVLDGEWIFALGMVLSALGAGSYYLYVDGGRSDRRLNVAANVLLSIGVVVIVIAFAIFD